MANTLKLLIILISGDALVGCVTTQEMKNRWLFVCPDGYQFTAEYSADFEYVEIESEGLSAKLRRSESASGARYSDGTLVFWSKGIMALLDIDENNVHRDCRGNTT